MRGIKLVEKLCAIAVLLAIGISGCLNSGSPPDQSPVNVSSNNSTNRSGHAEKLDDFSPPSEPSPTAPPDDVNVAESGEIAGPFSRNWTWNVASRGFNTFAVRVTVSGSGIAPQYRLADYDLLLVDPTGRTVQRSTGTRTSGAEDLISYSGSSMDTPLGRWSIGFTSGAGSAAHYELVVSVDY